MKKYIYVLQYNKLNIATHASLLSAFTEVGRLKKKSISVADITDVAVKLEKAMPATKIRIGSSDGYYLSRFELKGASHV